MKSRAHPAYFSAPTVSESSGSHQIQVESNELQPRHQGQEESQVIMAADQGIPVRHKKGQWWFWVCLPAWSSLTNKPAVLKCDM